MDTASPRQQRLEKVAVATARVAALIAILAWVVTWWISLSSSSSPFGPEGGLDLQRFVEAQESGLSAKWFAPCYQIFCWSFVLCGLALVIKSGSVVIRRPRSPGHIILAGLGLVLSCFFFLTVTGLCMHLTGLSKLNDIYPDPARATEYLKETCQGRGAPDSAGCEALVEAIATLKAKIDVDLLESATYREPAKPQGPPGSRPGDPNRPIRGGRRRGSQDAQPTATVPLGPLYSILKWTPDVLETFENDWLAPINELAGTLETRCSSACGYPIGFFVEHEETAMEFLRNYRTTARILRLRTHYYHQKGDLDKAASSLRLLRDVAKNFDPQSLLQHMIFQSCMNVLYYTTAELCFMTSDDAPFITTLQEIIAAPEEPDTRLVRALSGEQIIMRYRAIKTGVPEDQVEGQIKHLTYILTLLSQGGLEETAHEINTYATSKMEQAEPDWNWVLDLDGWRGIPTLVLTSWQIGPADAGELLDALLVPAFAAVVEKTYGLSLNQRMADLCCALKQYKLKRGTFPETLDALTDTTIPADWQQLPDGYHYRTQGDRFVIYSLGKYSPSLEEILAIMQTGRGNLDRFNLDPADFYVIGE